jgi:crotonobetainyl-CoA:carnitine CoA-transferase CaiB-like acyl-CoA transferase
VTGPLAGLRVLDLSRILAAPLTSQLLGDMGAEVIKVERPGVGDDARQYGPPFFGDPDDNQSGSVPTATSARSPLTTRGPKVRS